MNRIGALVVFLSLTQTLGPLAGGEPPSSPPSYLDASTSVELPEFTVTIEPFKAEATSHPGLIQRLWSARFEDYPEIDVRVVPNLALYVPEGESPSVFLPSGPFGAEWEGTILFEAGGEHRFSAKGTGRARVEIHGVLAFESDGSDLSAGTIHPLSFAPGPHPIRVRYESPAEGDARFQLSWSTDEFQPETISSRLLTHEHLPDDLKRGIALRRGRQAVSTYRCLNCHSRDGIDPESAMKGLDRDAPTFEGIGSRLRFERLFRQTLSPHSTRDEAEMPSLLHYGLTTRSTGEARLMAQALSSLRQVDLEGAMGRLDNPSLRARGERIFQEQDCAACHTYSRLSSGEVGAGEEVAPPDSEEEEADLLSLDGLDAKWFPAALVEFLRKPDRWRSSIRMPDFGLTLEEAEALTAFLIDSPEDGRGESPILSEEISRGMDLLRERRCLNCHSLEGGASVPQSAREAETPALAPPFDSLNLGSGCLASHAGIRGTAPDFNFEEGLLEAIREYLKRGLDSLNRHVPSEFAQSRLAEMRCFNCHQEESESDGVGWDAFVSLSELLLVERGANDSPAEDFGLEEEWAEFPADATVSQHQARPNLEWAGEKLRTDWVESLLLGALSEKPRPLLPARMPAYREEARALSVGLAALHGEPPEGFPDRGGDVDPAGLRAGEQILLEPPGLNCIACHPVGSRPAGSGAPGAAINLDLAAARLRRPFFDRIMRTPQRVTRNSPMPEYIDSSGRTAAETFLDGDAERQLNAIWEYLVSIAGENR